MIWIDTTELDTTLFIDVTVIWLDQIKENQFGSVIADMLAYGSFN
jgi:hypothetical protein